MQEPDGGLVVKVALRVGVGFVVIAALVIAPSGTLEYWPGWAFLGTLFVPMLGATAYLLSRDRALLERRMQLREREPTQRAMIIITNVLLVVGFALPGLDYRFGWSRLPAAVLIVGDVFVFVGYALVFWVLRTNTFAARTVQVEQEQRVIDTGPYKWVRHPMYSGVLLMMLAAPLGLGSLWALLLLALSLPPLLLWRISGEEELLREQLPGYDEYCERVRWRLVPGVW